MRLRGALALLAACAAACAGPRPAPRVLTPAGVAPPVEWSAAERALPLAGRPLGSSAAASWLRVRLSGAEEPHVHAEDLVVVLLSGRALLHLPERSFEMRPGDVALVPRGTRHYAVNAAGAASEAFVLFAPPPPPRE